MLATLTDRRFSDPGWVFEPKFDGERCLAFRKGPQVRLLSRNRKRLNHHYPELAEALAVQDADDFVVDGEVVAFERGRSSFARLQRRMQLGDPEAARRSGVAVHLYLFDVLHVHSHDVTRLGLRQRKAVLRRLLAFRDPLRFTPHRNADGEAYWQQACRKGWEGVIAKRADAPYRHDRSGDWLKFKCATSRSSSSAGTPTPRGPGTASAPCCSATTAAATWSTPARSGPASTTSCSSASDAGWPRWSRSVRRSRSGDSPARGCTGCGPSWSPRSASANGPTTGSSAIPGSWGSGTTSAPARWYGSDRDERQQTVRVGGGTKLQGTLPLDEERRNQAEEELAAELRAFLDRGDAEEADAAHAREALGLLGG
jgi:ATP dependent DNA ligase domain